MYRRSCGLEIGDRVLLVADTELELLVVFPPAAIDEMAARRLAQLDLGGAW